MTKPITLFLILHTLSFSISSSLNSDGLALLGLKSAINSDPTNSLESWSESDPTPCNWDGVTCTHGQVTSLSLVNKRLSGYIPSELGAIVTLRNLSLSRNNFSNVIPSHLFNAISLVSLDLSYNSLSGSIPNQIISLTELNSLDLSSNELNGSLPIDLTDLMQLSGTLNLSYNRFYGAIPASYGGFPMRVSLDLRYNNLSGEIPQVGSLLNQGPTAFDGNPSLCGFPLSVECSRVDKDENFDRKGVEKEKPESWGTRSGLGRDKGGARRERFGSGSGSGSRSIVLVSGLFAVVGGVLFVLLWVSRRKKVFIFKEGKMVNKGEFREEGVGHVIGVVVEKDEEEKGQNGKFTVVDDEGFGLELEDLLRAPAYVIGKGRSGIVYKVVVVGGKGSCVVAPTVVAVRRLSEGDDVAAWRIKEFEYEIETIGKVRHPNVLGLRAYYYAHDEKLLVTDFVRNGSLHTALHGGSSNDLQPLSWASRLKIAQGIARGMTYIHECSPRKYFHGNFKSSKVLLGEDFHPYIAGFGLNRLVRGASKWLNPSSNRSNLNPNPIVLMGSKMFGPSFAPHCAPEGRSEGKMTQKCDVYSFGIVLMEILTGRLPDTGSENGGKGLESLVRSVFWQEKPLSEIIDPTLLHEVYAKKQVLAMFHIALNCTELDPELRPRMRTVSERLSCLEYQ